MEAAIKRIKQRDFELVAQYRASLMTEPRLTYLFLELTDRCNLTCLHCGSNCSGANRTDLPLSYAQKTLRSVASTLDTSQVMLCLTGGEPFLYPHFFEVVELANELGFPWGVTSNGTLITNKMAKKLKS